MGPFPFPVNPQRAPGGVQLWAHHGHGEMEPLLPAGGARPWARPRRDARGRCHGAQRAWGEAKAVAARRMGGPGRKALCFPEIPTGLGPLQHLHKAFRGKKHEALSSLQLVGTAHCPAFP